MNNARTSGDENGKLPSGDKSLVVHVTDLSENSMGGFSVGGEKVWGGERKIFAYSDNQIERGSYAQFSRMSVEESRPGERENSSFFATTTNNSTMVRISGPNAIDLDSGLSLPFVSVPEQAENGRAYLAYRIGGIFVVATPFRHAKKKEFAITFSDDEYIHRAYLDVDLSGKILNLRMTAEEIDTDPVPPQPAGSYVLQTAVGYDVLPPGTVSFAARPPLDYEVLWADYSPYVQTYPGVTTKMQYIDFLYASGDYDVIFKMYYKVGATNYNIVFGAIVPYASWPTGPGVVDITSWVYLYGGYATYYAYYLAQYSPIYIRRY